MNDVELDPASGYRLAADPVLDRGPLFALGQNIATLSHADMRCLAETLAYVIQGREVVESDHGLAMDILWELKDALLSTGEAA